MRQKRQKCILRRFVTAFYMKSRGYVMKMEPVIGGRKKIKSGGCGKRRGKSYVCRCFGKNFT